MRRLLPLLIAGALVALAFLELRNEPAPRIPIEVPPPPETPAVRTREPAPAYTPLPRYEGESTSSRGEAFELLRRGHARLSDGDWWAAVSDLARAHAALPDRDDACVLLAIAYHQLNLVHDVLALLPCVERAARNGHPSASQLLDVLDRSADIEKEFRVVTSDHFVASHPASVTGGEVGLVLDQLERSRAELERLLGFATDRLVSVVIYETDQFGDATTAPHWAMGQYDGKIRFAVRMLDEPRDRLEHVLLHEYAHALVHDVARRPVPAWFNEGLANSVGEPRHDGAQLTARLQQSPTLLSIRELSETFSTLPREEAEIAYQQSYWMTRNLVHEIGWDGMSQLLGALQDDPQATFEDAFIEATGETPAGYLDRWYDLVLAP